MRLSSVAMWHGGDSFCLVSINKTRQQTDGGGGGCIHKIAAKYRAEYSLVPLRNNPLVGQSAWLGVHVSILQ
jgi:hypothetical protein